jgi:hypothetical protein
MGSAPSRFLLGAGVDFSELSTRTIIVSTGEVERGITAGCFDLSSDTTGVGITTFVVNRVEVADYDSG